MDPRVALTSARNPKTSSDELAELARSEFAPIREMVARHPNTDATTLARLAPPDLGTDTYRSLAFTLAANPNTPATPLVDLLQRIDPKTLDGSTRPNAVYEALAIAITRHRNLPEESVAALLSQPEICERVRLQIGR